MNKSKILTSILFFLLVIPACSKDDKKGTMKGMKKMNSSTKIVMVNGIQAAFDFMDKAGHDKMMKLMKMDMKKMKLHKDSNHFIALTLMDKKTKKPIKNAEVTFIMTGPDNKKQKKTGHRMSGEGMFHYGGNFKMSATKGKCNVIAEIKIDGKNLKAETAFEME